MKCELCGNETEFGNPYFCYYGKLIRSETSAGPADFNIMQTRMTVSRYHMGGEKSAWFCDRCVATRYGTGQRNPSIYGCFIIGLLSCCSVSGMVFNPDENLGAFLKIIVLFALILGLAALFPLIRGIRALYAAGGDSTTLHELLRKDLGKSGWINAAGDELVIKREKAELTKQGFDSFFTRRDKPTPIPPQT
jgi:hypothetical protein